MMREARMRAAAFATPDVTAAQVGPAEAMHP